MIGEKDVKVRMRDGVDIDLRIYRPDGSGRYPALFAASPYRYDNNILPCSPLFLWRKNRPDRMVRRGSAYKLEIPLLPHAWRFAKGSRILSCADSPITDFLFSHIYRSDKHGTDTIHHDTGHPSELVLPVLLNVNDR